MNVIGTPGNGRAQIAGRNIPLLHAILLGQQGPVEQLHRLRVGKINAGQAMGIGFDMWLERRAGRNQRRKVILSLMAIARMQAGGGGFVPGRRLGGHAASLTTGDRRKGGIVPAFRHAVRRGR
jgi:hypothetical protein